MEYSSSAEADGCFTSHKIPCFLQNLRPNCHFQRNRPLVCHHPNQPRPQLWSYYCHTNIHITLPCKYTSLTWTLPFTFSNYNFVHICYYSHACYMAHLFYLPSPYYVNNMCSAVQIMELLTIQLSPQSCHFSFLGQSLLSTLYQNFSAPCIRTSICFLPLQCVRPSFTPIQNNTEN
jgi:hypothetical protein